MAGEFCLDSSDCSPSRATALGLRSPSWPHVSPCSAHIAPAGLAVVWWTGCLFARSGKRRRAAPRDTPGSPLPSLLRTALVLRISSIAARASARSAARSSAIRICRHNSVSIGSVSAVNHSAVRRAVIFDQMARSRASSCAGGDGRRSFSRNDGACAVYWFRLGMAIP